MFLHIRLKSGLVVKSWSEDFLVLEIVLNTVPWLLGENGAFNDIWDKVEWPVVVIVLVVPVWVEEQVWGAWVEGWVSSDGINEWSLEDGSVFLNVESEGGDFKIWVTRVVGVNLVASRAVQWSGPHDFVGVWSVVDWFESSSTHPLVFVVSYSGHEGAFNPWVEVDTIRLHVEVSLRLWTMRSVVRTVTEVGISHKVKGEILPWGDNNGVAWGTVVESRDWFGGSKSKESSKN